MKKVLLLAVGLAAMFNLVSCSSDDDDNGTGGNGKKYLAEITVKEHPWKFGERTTYGEDYESYKYDEKGNLVRKTTNYYSAVVDMRILHTYDYTYDNKNRVIVMDEWGLSTYKYKYQYNEYDSVSVMQKYNKDGKLYTEYTYEYDNSKRMSQLTERDALSSTGYGYVRKYSYSGNTVTEDNGQNTTTKTYDALSRLIEVEDNSGTTSYTLHANGNPLEIDVLGNSLTFAYDNYGRRTTMIDPSRGTTTYQYDNAGNTSNMTDANNNVTQMTYDKYGRMTSKQNGDFTTTYTYNNTLNKLSSVSSTNGTAKTFTYDSYGRLTVSKENATNSIWFQQAHSYDTAGRLASTAYASNKGTLGTENFTYQNNNVYEVRWDTTSIFRQDAIGNIGYPTSVYTGPLHRTYGYSSAGQPTGRIVLNGSTQVMNQAYSYHSTTGNLITRCDNIANMTENFTYDSLDRLTQYGTSTVTYDDYGNITAKSDVGSYAYNNSDKPFAVTDVALSSAIPRSIVRHLSRPVTTRQALLIMTAMSVPA